MKDLTEGSIVHYVLPNGEHRPAIVVRDWSNKPIYGQDDGVVNLCVFTDGSNDKGAVYGNVSEQGLLWATSVHHDPAGNMHHTWHWIEKA